MPMQIFGGLKRCIMGFAQVVNAKIIKTNLFLFFSFLFFFFFRNSNPWVILLRVKNKLVVLLLEDFVSTFRHAHKLYLSNA